MNTTSGARRVLRVRWGIAVLSILVAAIVAATLVRSALGDSPPRAEDVFPVFEREPMAQDRPGDEVREMFEEVGPDGIRYLEETDKARYYVVEDERGWVCIARELKPGLTGIYAARACEPPEEAAKDGVFVGAKWSNGPMIYAGGVPEGYSRVVDVDGNLVGEIENQLFVMEYELGNEPDTLIAEGNAGRLELATPDPFHNER